MAQGFPREEAEHLAVQEMGPVAPTNRAFLGHAFTSSLGWLVLGALLFTGGIWAFLERDAIFWKDTSVTNILLDTQDLEFAMRQTPAFTKPPKLVKAGFYLPRGTRTLEYAIISKHGHYQSTVISDQGGFVADVIGRKPHRFSMLIGEGQMLPNHHRMPEASSFKPPPHLIKQHGGSGRLVLLRPTTHTTAPDLVASGPIRNYRAHSLICSHGTRSNSIRGHLCTCFLQAKQTVISNTPIRKLPTHC